MTDTAATAASGTTGQGAAAANGTAGQSNGGTVDPFAGLVDPGIREWVGKAGIKDTSIQSFEAVAKTAREAQTLIGRSIQVPGDDAKAEDVDKYLSKATEKFRPKDATGYEFSLPEGVPAEMPYDGEAAKEFKGVAHELGLTAKQAQKAHDWFVKRQAGAYTTSAEGLVKQAGDATAALEKLWGKSDSDGFKANIELAAKGVRKSGGDELMDALRKTGLLGPGDVIMSVPIAKAFAEIGKHYSEDRLVTPPDGSGAAATDNPFTGTNNTLQMRAISADPTKARRLIAAAGKKPSDFGLSDA